MIIKSHTQQTGAVQYPLSGLRSTAKVGQLVALILWVQRIRGVLNSVYLQYEQKIGGRLSEWLGDFETDILYTLKELVGEYEKTNPKISWLRERDLEKYGNA